MLVLGLSFFFLLLGSWFAFLLVQFFWTRTYKLERLIILQSFFFFLISWNWIHKSKLSISSSNILIHLRIQSLQCPFALCMTSVACAIGPIVSTSSTDFSFQNLIFWNLFEFSALKNQYLPHFESKSYEINSIKSCSSRSFQQDQRHIPILLKFSAMI
jgi:hypothetical protein